MSRPMGTFVASPELCASAAAVVPSAAPRVAERSGYDASPMPRLRLAAALTAAVQSGWEGLVAEHGAYVDDGWGRADVAGEGDERIQQAVRCAW